MKKRIEINEKETGEEFSNKYDFAVVSDKGYSEVSACCFVAERLEDGHYVVFKGVEAGLGFSVLKNFEAAHDVDEAEEKAYRRAKTSAILKAGILEGVDEFIDNTRFAKEEQGA